MAPDVMGAYLRKSQIMSNAILRFVQIFAEPQSFQWLNSAVYGTPDRDTAPKAGRSGRGFMKTLLAMAAAIVAMGTCAAHAQFAGQGTGYGTNLYGTGSNPNSHYVQPHTNRNGSYVPGHYQTNPNGTRRDNYGTVGNVNPYTGIPGTR